MKRTTPVKSQLIKAGVLLGVVTCGWLCTAFTDADNADCRLSNAQFPTPVSLLQEFPGIESGPGPVDGHWQFPGLQWTFSQSSPKTLNEFPDPPVSDAVAGSSCELDHHLLELITSLMTAEAAEGKRRTYSLNSAELAGTAVTVISGGMEIPVSIQIRWPAYDELWTEMTAQRIQDWDVVEPLLQLPRNCEIVATRIAHDGAAQCHLISSSLNGNRLRRQFSADGWKLDEPPMEAGLDGIFWISSAAGRFEVSIKEAIREPGLTALIRSL